MAAGKKTGGRQKGSKNKAPTKAALAATVAKALTGSDLTPLEYMLQVMRTDPDPEMRFEAAKAAAPYVHNRLAAVEHTGKDGAPIALSLEVRFV